jgi:hypothetical protein
MIKRSPAFAIPNSPKAFWNPKNIPNVQIMLAKMAGFDMETLTFPEIESYNPVLTFPLAAGQTRTESLASKNGTWILLEKMATINPVPQATFIPAFYDLITVSSYFVSDISNTNVTLIEEQPVSLVFGTGEWQSSFLPETWTSVNNRVFSVKNKSSYDVTVSLGFKLSRVAPRVIY